MSTALQQTLFGKRESHELAGIVGQEEVTSANLGVLFWFTVPELKIERPALANAYAQAGIPASFLPSPIQPADAFRRATSRLHREGDPVSVLIREAGSDKEGIVRQAVVEVRRKNEKSLRYAPAAALTFKRRTGLASVDRLDDGYLSLPVDAQAVLDEQIARAASFRGEVAK